jgi:outer membrane biosynthesis protein TonB
MTKSHSNFGSKVRIATAGAVVGIVASLMTGTAAQAVPANDLDPCTRYPQLCEGGGVVVDPPPPPKPPKCQVILCEGDTPVLDPVNDPVSEPQPEPEPEPEPTQQPEEPKTEEPKTEEPKNDTPANTGQNNGNGSGRNTGTVSRNVQQVEQVEAAPVESTDEMQTVAQSQGSEAQSGLSQFAKLFILFTLAGAAYGLFTYLRQRKNS